MRLFALCALALVACAEAPPPVATPSVHMKATDDARLEQAEQAYLNLIVETSPERATSLGLHARDSELDNESMAGWERAVAEKEAMLKALRLDFATASLSPSGKTDLTILEHALSVEVAMAKARRPLETQPDVYAEPLDALYAMTARNYAPKAERARAVLMRLMHIPEVVAQAKKNLKNPPRVWTLIGIDRANGAKAFFTDLRAELVSGLPGQETEIDLALAIAGAAYADYKTFLEHDVLPRSSGSFAAGRATFEMLVHDNYFLTESVETLRALGQRVFDETDAQMNALAKEIDPTKKAWPDVTKALKGHHAKAGELFAMYKGEVARARAFLVEKDAVPFPEGDVCNVVPTPPFERSTINAAYDEAPPFDADPHGLFYVTPVDESASAETQEEMLRENDHGDAVNTAVHETYPGHHLQLSFARRHPSRIRKATAPDIFEEGWAFYAEELMSELGFYSKEERLMQLEWTLVRAGRVLLDVDLHTGGMTYEAAVAFLMNRVHLERELAESEAKRYTLEPTQPLAYLVGREKIMKLRERFKERAGAHYSLKAFHAEVLSHGSIAPSLLEAEMFGP